MKEIKIKVSGMMCSGCENRIKNALEAIEGVESVEATHIEGIVTVILNNAIETQILEQKIEDIGFEVIKED